MTTLPIVGPTKLPEGKDWVDDGCQFSPSCLNCPLERCYLDTHRSADVLEMRSEYIVHKFIGGVSVRSIASRLHVSERTVHRELQKYRKGEREVFSGETDETPHKYDPKRHSQKDCPICESFDASLSDLRPISRKRAPLPVLRPGVSSSRAVFERS